MTRGGGTPEAERFYLTVSVESTKRFSDYVVDVDFPIAFLPPHPHTDTYKLFRATPEEYRRFINPGRNDLQGIEFFVKRDGSQQDLISKRVIVTAYVEDIKILSEHTIEELCSKENPLVFREA
jgi:hypothetical protein